MLGNCSYCIHNGADKAGTWATASGEQPGLQHATTSITHKSIPIAGRNLDYTLLEMLGETADPKLITCNEIPNFTQLQIYCKFSTRSSKEGPIDNAVTMIRRLPLLQRQELNLGLSLNITAPISLTFSTETRQNLYLCTHQKHRLSDFCWYPKLKQLNYS